MWGVAKHRPAAPAPQPCQRPALRDGQHGLMGFVLLTGGFIMSRRHLHVAPVTLRHMVLLEGSARGSKKSFSLLVYRKKTLPSFHRDPYPS